jgi:TRAP-type C4-dicarboxylate transport system substrate-binding protein
MLKVTGALIGAACMALCTQTAVAQTVDFTVAAGQPPRALPSLAKVGDFFVPEVKRRVKEQGLNIDIRWKEAYAGSLLKPMQMLDGIKDGLATIGYVPSVFYPDKLPLEQLSFYVPFMTSDVVLVSKIMGQLHKTLPEFGAQYHKFNQVRIGGSGVDSYELLTTFPVRSVEDLKGKKIGTGGVALSWLRALGGTGVQSNMMEYYNSIKTGVYQGTIIMPSTFRPMKYPEVAPHVTKVGFGAQYAVVLSVNKDVFDKLPPELQKILFEVAEQWGIESDKAYMTAGDDGYRSLSEFKATLYELSREEQVRWASTMPNLAKEWAQSMDKQGLPGTKALSMFMDELRKAGVKPIRDWDKE